MGKIRIQCSECGHEARVPEQFRSKKVRCLRCHAKLRIPEDAPVEADKTTPQGRGDKGGKERAPEGRPAPRPAPAGRRGGKSFEAEAQRGGPSSKTRREAMTILRELLHEYDHAIESVPRGFEIDLRGVAFGLARTLVEEMLLCQAIRDVKLAGGTGECRIVVTLQGHAFSPEDSFAADDDDTEVFQRPGGRGAGLIELAHDEHTDPARHLDEKIPDAVRGTESQMQPLFAPTQGGGGQSSSRGSAEPVALYERALQHIEDGEPQEAVPLLEKAVKADMNFSRAVSALGKAYASLGDYQKARRALRHLVKLEANDPEAQVLYAAACVRCEKLEDAREALGKAIKTDPNYVLAYRYAAQLYEKLGDEETARKFKARYQALKLQG